MIRTAQAPAVAQGASAPDATSGQASPRDNVVFEAGLFGGVLGMRRTFILHAHGSKLPTDLLGLTSVRYGESITPAEMKAFRASEEARLLPIMKAAGIKPS